MDGFERLPRRSRPTRRRPGHHGDLPVGARRGGRQGGRAAARRRGLHHQADPARGSAGPGRRTTSPASISSARCGGSRDRLDSRTGQRRAHAAPDPAPGAARPARRPVRGTATGPAVMPAATTTTCSTWAMAGLGLMVADVSGHGAPAAIVMAMIRAALHRTRHPTDPAAVLRCMNEHFALPVGHRDVRHRHLRRGGRRAAGACGWRAPAIPPRCSTGGARPSEGHQSTASCRCC